MVTWLGAVLTSPQGPYRPATAREHSLGHGSVGQTLVPCVPSFLAV